MYKRPVNPASAVRLASPRTAIERKVFDMALLHRREFLETAAASTSASLLGFGTALAQFGPSASNQIRIGVIGTGSRGRQLIDQVPSPGRVVAICDVDLSRAGKTKERRGTSWPVYQDYRQMLDKEQLDAAIRPPTRIDLDPCLAGGSGRLRRKAVIAVHCRRTNARQSRSALWEDRTGRISTADHGGERFCLPFRA